MQKARARCPGFGFVDRCWGNDALRVSGLQAGGFLRTKRRWRHLHSLLSGNRPSREPVIDVAQHIRLDAKEPVRRMPATFCRLVAAAIARIDPDEIEAVMFGQPLARIGRRCHAFVMGIRNNQHAMFRAVHVEASKSVTTPTRHGHGRRQHECIGQCRVTLQRIANRHRSGTGADQSDLRVRETLPQRCHNGLRIGERLLRQSEQIVDALRVIGRRIDQRNGIASIDPVACRANQEVALERGRAGGIQMQGARHAGKQHNHPRRIRRRRFDENALRHAIARWERDEIAVIERIGVDTIGQQERSKRIADTFQCGHGVVVVDRFVAGFIVWRSRLAASGRSSR